MMTLINSSNTILQFTFGLYCLHLFVWLVTKCHEVLTFLPSPIISHHPNTSYEFFLQYTRINLNISGQK